MKKINKWTAGRVGGVFFAVGLVLSLPMVAAFLFSGFMLGFCVAFGVGGEFVGAAVGVGFMLGSVAVAFISVGRLLMDVW